MTTSSNKTFRHLLEQYNSPEEFSFSIKVPDDLQKLIDRRIFMHRDKILVPPFGIIYTVIDKSRKLSEIEDFNNHFHVDGYAKPRNDKTAFKLAIKTLTLLASKFERRNITGIRFWLSFASREMCEQFAKAHNFHEKGDKYYISDRLTFYKRRENEEIIKIDDSRSTSGILIIDI